MSYSDTLTLDTFGEYVPPENANTIGAWAFNYERVLTDHDGSIRICHAGMTLTAREWARELEIRPDVFYERLGKYHRAQYFNLNSFPVTRLFHRGIV